MTGHHTAQQPAIQTAILSEVGTSWFSAAELAAKFDRWTASYIRSVLFDLHQEGVLFRRHDAATGAKWSRDMTTKYTRRRDPLEAYNTIIPRRQRTGAVLCCACCGLPKEVADANPS